MTKTPDDRHLELLQGTLDMLILRTPMFAIAYWLWRLRSRRSVRGIVRVSACQAPAIAQVQL